MRSIIAIFFAGVFFAACSKGDAQVATPTSAPVEEEKVDGDLLPRIQFQNAEAAIVEQGKTLKVSEGTGFAFAFLPGIDLKERRKLRLEVKASGGAFYLELKSKNGDVEEALIGKTRQNNVFKVRIDLPDTMDAFKPLVLDLGPELRPDQKPAAVIVISDADKDFEIQKLQFDRP